MKKFFTPLLALCLLSNSVNAVTVEIQVLNNQFSPKNANVIVGDVVSFKFSSGFHNAVGSSIPAGAADINSGAPATGVRTYNYTVTEVGTYDYICEIHVLSGMTGSFTASSPLPVSLKSFLVSASADKKPVLTWTTLTEQNVKYFSVRSSVDGSKFAEIGRVAAKGNSIIEQTYSYTHSDVPTKYRYLYYEVVSIDKDGKESFSPIKGYKTGFATRKLIVQFGPNPITRPGQITLQFNAEKEGAMTINVFDINGKKMLTDKLEAMPGLNNGHVHVCDLAPGVYTLQFNYEGLTETKKVVVN